ncbi:MAG: hypothetical protein DHS20C15_16900 [Planctomycetota bacterium]|nr:MAG: hypothetical protein DHS20C15_16900 [Planctomycetota bacterium]
MNTLGNKVIRNALLAVFAIGLGVQTYRLVQLEHRLEALEGQRISAESNAVSGAAPPEVSTTDLAVRDDAQPEPIQPDRPRRRRGAVPDPFALLDDWPLFGPGWMGDALFPRASSLFGDLRDSGALHLQAGLQDRGAHYELEIPLPSGDSEIEVSVEGNLLHVATNHHSDDSRDEAGSSFSTARRYGSFEQRLSLPHDADGSALRTEQESDLLRVIVPKRV